jgi:hypothetical protein
MPADESTDPGGDNTGQRRCPACWTPFTPNHPSNPHPRRYCCGACRIEASRRRRRRDGQDPTTPPPAMIADEYRYNPPPHRGPCPEHPHCILTNCARFLCPNTVHVTIQRGQPRRYCSPACRVAEHRRLS